MLRLVNRFAATEIGTRYTTEMTIGLAGPLGRSANLLLRRTILAGAKGQAWMRHHVEEIGTLEHFLPRLYAERPRFEQPRAA